MSDQDNLGTRPFHELVASYDEVVERMGAVREALEAATDDPEKTDEDRGQMTREFTGLVDQAERLKAEIDSQSARKRATERYQKLSDTNLRIQVKEPDIYRNDGPHSFMQDLYFATAKRGENPSADARINQHQAFEIEKRAVTTGTLGGIVPPQYMVDLYAKASRNGRVFADQVNRQALPDYGMSIVLPRLTQGLAAGSQTSENTTVTTQDPTETDLTLNVRTIAGYSPVSRQGIERAVYNDRILFEDLIARYWAQLDTQCLNGAGTSGTLLGLIQTSGIATSAATTLTAAGVYPKIADLCQQISTNMGGIGYLPDKIFMHPRRWGFFAASFDSQNRPLIVPSSQAYNAMGDVSPGDVGGIAGGYGGPIGVLQGLPVYVDANIPTNLGTNTNEDRIIVVASQVTHLFERANDPVTLSFEQTAGTSLQVQLIVYGYVAFTAGRYPSACGVVTGLTPPSF